MVWTAPRTWVAGEKPSAATMNLHIRDNLKFLGDDSGWITPTLSNSWVSYDAGVTYDVPQYSKLGPLVWIKGLMKSGTTGTTIFTLPAGYRPLKSRVFTVAAIGGGARIDITAAGVVSLLNYIGAGANGFVSLEISYRAEA